MSVRRPEPRVTDKTQILTNILVTGLLSLLFWQNVIERSRPILKCIYILAIGLQKHCSPLPPVSTLKLRAGCSENARCTRLAFQAQQRWTTVHLTCLGKESTGGLTCLWKAQKRSILAHDLIKLTSANEIQFIYSRVKVFYLCWWAKVVDWETRGV